MSRAWRVWFVRVGAIALMACTDPISQNPTAVQLAFIVQPSDATAGIAINPDVAVAIQDRSGNLVTSATDVVRLTVDSNASGGSLAGTASVPAVNGVATFSNLRVVTAGTGYTLKAASTGLATATSTEFAIAAAAASRLAFTVQPSQTVQGAAITPPVQVAAQDSFGNLVTNATNVVTLTIGSAGSGGSLAGTVSVPAVNGVATFSNVRIVTAGRGYTLKAASTGLAAATSTQFAIAAAAASHLAFTVQPSQTVQGAAITPPVQVAAQDSFGNLATEFQDSVTVALPGNPPIASLSGTTVVRAVNGVATFNDLSIAQANAEYTLIASAGALTSIASSPFNIAKPPVTLRVSTRTAGVSLDPDGYSVCVDPYQDPGDFGHLCTWSSAVGVNSDVTMLVAPGAHRVELDDAAVNCTVGEVTTVDAGDTIHVSFAITCFAAGAVRVTTATTGIDSDSYYGVCIGPSGVGCTPYGGVPANGAVIVPGVPVGPQTVTLYDVASNCTVSGGQSRALSVPQDGTVDVAFDVRCVVAERIAFSHDGTIVVNRVRDVWDPQTIIRGLAPAWSPDGATLAYECGQDICTINPGGAVVRRLTGDGAGNHHPNWSPDGSKIAFAATHAGVTDLYVTASNGSGGTRRLTQSVGFVGSPAWSPDGTRIAFDCSMDAGNDDICWMNADGTGFARLTNDPARDYGAAWKPDGSALAFATTRYGADEIVLMGVNGGGVARIGAGLPGFAPSWSPDGTQLAFVQLVQRDYDGDWYTTSVISTANADGSGVRTLNDGDQPAWKPHP